MSATQQDSILIVDDQPGKLMSLEAILAPLNEHIIKAGSAREALDCLLKNEISVILVDVCMPELDGFELAQLIREHPRFRNTAIIFISAVLLSDSDRLRGYDLGAVDYIPVPLIPEVLRARVSVFVELHRKTDQLERLNLELEQRVAERTAALEASTARLQESEERLNLALDSAGAASWDWELGSIGTDWSSRYRDLYGFAPEDPPTLDTWLNRIHPDDRLRVHARLEQVRATPGDDTWNEEFRIVHPVAGVRWLSGRGSVVRGATDGAVRLTGIDLDITGRKRGEEDRTRLLQSEREARAAAEQANRLKDEFLATVSHELRNPINSVHLLIQLARRKKLGNGVLDDALEGIERGVRTQTRLIDDLLDISRITAGKLRIEVGTVELGTILRSALDPLLPLANDKGLTIRTTLDSAPIAVDGDQTRLQQVFGNLLDNAIKFTPKGGSIEVSTSRAPGQAIVTVADTGRGIQRAFLPYVFDRFRQADSSIARSFGGLGLGLAIVKHIVELHGGEIRVESEGEGRGARFTVMIPLAQASIPAAMGNKSCTDGDLAGIRLLVVEDDADSRDALARLLTECGAETATAENVPEALEKIARERPDVLISDIGMPGQDGYDLIRTIRADVDGERLPAIVLTAFARSQDRARALHAGYNAYLSKPVNTAELLALIGTLVRDLSPAVKN